MTKRERVCRTLLRKSVDTTPYSFDLTGKVMERLAAYYGCKADEVHDRIGDHFLWFYPGQDAGFVPRHTSEGTYTDEFGALYRNDGVTNEAGDWGALIGHPLSGPSFEGYTYPDAKRPGRFRSLDGHSMKAQERYRICAMMGLFDRGWHLCGFENFMMYMLSDPDFTNAALDRALEFNLDIIAQMPDWADGVRFGEDWGQQKGLLMGSRLWRGQLKPRLKILYEAARKRGLDVFIHSCGDIAEIFPDLIEIGVQAVNPIQPEVMDISFLKREYGRDMVFYGGLPCQSIIPNGTPEQNLEACRSIYKILSEDGGYIYGPAGAIPTETPLDNLLVVIDYAEKGYTT